MPVLITMVKFPFRGVIAPVFSPFHNDRSLNLTIIPGYAKFLAKNGVKAVLVNGTTGEGMLQNVKDRMILAEKWMETKRIANQHVMVQVGGAPLPDVLDLAQHAESLGVDSILCLPELYYRPTTINELINYLRMVGEAAPRTPLLYYHIPLFTHVTIHMGQLLREVERKIPTLVGIKFTSEDFDEGLEALNAQNKKFAVFLGTDTYMTQAYKRGFDSTISTTLNIFPQFGAKIHEYTFDGKVKEAEELQQKLNKIFKCITKYGKFKTQPMKEAMSLFTPFNVGPPKHPIVRLSTEEIKGIKYDVKALNNFNSGES